MQAYALEVYVKGTVISVKYLTHSYNKTVKIQIIYAKQEAIQITSDDQERL